jgi:hypothetical protein
MDKQVFFEETTALEGPDYVALVIEWDDIADTIENEITEKTTQVVPQRHRLASVLAGLGVIALAAWGVHRLRAA